MRVEPRRSFGTIVNVHRRGVADGGTVTVHAMTGALRFAR